MPFDDDLTTGLTALAARANPNPGNPEGLLRRHAVQQRRRIAVRGGALLAVTATGAVLTLPHLGEGGDRAGLATGASAFLDSGTPTATRQTLGGADLDPQVFTDVVAGAFPLPGPSQLRWMRINRSARSLLDAQCGGTEDPHVDSTAMRLDQARYADLDLIQARGLTEAGDGNDRGKLVELGACTRKLMPHFEAWLSLGSSWDDATLTALQTSAVQGTLPKVTSCLRRKSGFAPQLDSRDPVPSFLGAVDGHIASLGKQEHASQARIGAEQTRASHVFVECTRSYFDAMLAALKPAQDAAIDRNRELLTQTAQEVVAAGYVP